MSTTHTATSHAASSLTTAFATITSHTRTHT
jgi:hypothetical protein